MELIVVVTAHLLLLMSLTNCSTAVPIPVSGRQDSPSKAATCLKAKRDAPSNEDKAVQCVIEGGVPIWTRSAADLSNSKDLVTVPAKAVHLADGHVYSPSIVASGCDKSLAIQLGPNCTISKELNEDQCPWIRQENISVTFCKDQRFRILSFNFTINQEFIDGRDNLSVSFIQYADRRIYSVSGYLYFNSQHSNSCDITTEASDATQCSCTTTGDSDQTQGPKQNLVTDLEQVSKVCSGSKLNRFHVHILGFLLVLVISLLFP